MVEARVRWDGEEIQVGYALPRDAIRLGSIVRCADDFVVARVIDGALTLVLPTGAPVPDGKGITLRGGGMRIDVAIVEDDTPDFTASSPRANRRAVVGILIGVAAHAAVVVGALVSGPTAKEVEASSTRELTAYLAAAGTRASSEELLSDRRLVAIEEERAVESVAAVGRLVSSIFV